MEKGPLSIKISLEIFLDWNYSISKDQSNFWSWLGFFMIEVGPLSPTFLFSPALTFWWSQCTFLSELFRCWGHFFDQGAFSVFDHDATFRLGSLFYFFGHFLSSNFQNHDPLSKIKPTFYLDQEKLRSRFSLSPSSLFTFGRSNFNFFFFVSCFLIFNLAQDQDKEFEF